MPMATTHCNELSCTLSPIAYRDTKVNGKPIQYREET